MSKNVAAVIFVVLNVVAIFASATPKERYIKIQYKILPNLPPAEKAIPSFDFNDLVNDLNGLSASQRGVVDNVAQASRNVGAFLIKNFPESAEYFEAVRQLEAGAADCFATSDKIVSLKVSPAVVRSTSAVASSDPSTAHPACISRSAETIERSMDAVGNVVHKLLDQISGSKANYKLPTDPEHLVPVSGSPSLDHIHLYSSTEDKDEPTAALHTDNGLFLLATPTAESPLHVIDSNGDALTTFTSEPAIVVLFGSALNDWLLASDDRVLFRAAPHYVPALQSGKQRLIVARMYVAPKEAVPAVGASVEFGNFFMAVEDPKLSTSNLCPSLKSRHRSSPMTSSASALLWRSARSTFCDQGLAFCWMACLPLEFDCPASEQSCYNVDHQPCCEEGQTPAEHGCLDMDITCNWHCNKAAN